MDVGDRIRVLRKEKCLTQKQLGERCGMADSAIRFYESGRGNPTEKTLRRIADALDVTVGYLQGYDDIDSKKLVDALKAHDYRAMEQMMGLPEGSITPIPPEELREIEDRMEQERHEKEVNLNKIKSALKFTYDKFTEQDYISLWRLIRPFSKLNQAGQQKAVESVEIIAGNPKYQRQSSPEGKDTPAAEPSPKSTENGE